MSRRDDPARRGSPWCFGFLVVSESNGALLQQLVSLVRQTLSGLPGSR